MNKAKYPSPDEMVKALSPETELWTHKMTRDEYMDRHTRICRLVQPEKDRRGMLHELHREYYAQFVTRPYIDKVVAHIGQTDILTSNDDYFNDITLRRWDFAPEPYDYRRKLRLCGDEPTAIGNAVCVAKEAARMWRDEQIGRYIEASLEYNRPTTEG